MQVFENILNNIINFINNNSWVYYIPTIFFVVMIILSILLGMKRGLYKSSHKFFVMALSLGVSIGLFYYFTTNLGSNLYDVVNKFTNGSGLTSLVTTINNSIDPQNQFNLSAEILYPNMYGVTLTIVSNMAAVKFGGFENIAIEIYPYIDVFAQATFKFALFLVCFVIFIVLSLVLNFFDWLFFSKRKRIKKFKKKEKKYRNHSLLGGFVGGCHGLVLNMILLSFIGFTFYVIGASTPNDGRKLYDNVDNVTFKDDSIASIYDLALFTDKLGNTGIFELLNKVQDKNNVPMYLFFANEIFSGHVINEIKPVLDGSGNQVVIDGKPQFEIVKGDKVLIGQQFRSFTALARDLMDVLVKHGGEDILALSGANKVDVNRLVALFNNEAFNKDIEVIIDKYQSTEYLKNITKATIGFISTNFDDVMKSVSPTNADKYIYMFDSIFGTNDDRLNNPDDYIKVEDIVTFDDAKTLMKGIVNSVPKLFALSDYMKNNKSVNTIDPTAYQLNVMNYSLEIFEDLTPYLENLSMFKETATDTRAARVTKVTKMNKLYDRMVDFAFTRIKDSNGNPIGNPYKGMNVKWNEEFFTFTSSISNICAINNEILENYKANDKMLMVINNVFSKDYVNRAVIDKNYEELIDKSCQYDVVKILLNSDMFYSLYEKVLSKAAGQKIVIPHDIVWNNEGDQKGELYNSLMVLREVIAEGTLTAYFNDPKLQDMNTFKEILAKLDSPYKDTTLMDYMFESKVLYYSTNAIISNLKVEPFEFIIPNHCKEEIAGVSLAKKADLVTAIKVLPNILKQIDDLNTIKNDPFALTDVISKVEVRNAIIDSDIITATISKTMNNLVKTNPSISDFLVMPADLDLTNDVDQVNLAKWLGANGELDNMLQTFSMIDVKALAKNDKAAIVNILNFNEQDFNKLLGSNVLHHTISKLITTINNPNFTIVVPTECLESNQEVIAKAELYKMVHGASKIISSDPQTNEFVFTFNNITIAKDEVLASNILYASLTSKILDINKTEVAKNIYIPSNYQNVDFNNISTSTWKTNKELESLLESFKVLGINLDSIVNGGFNPNDFTKQLLTLDEEYNGQGRTKIDALYDSKILALTLSETIKNEPSLVGKVFIPDGAYTELTGCTERVIGSYEWNNLITGVKTAFGLSSNDDLIAQFKDFNTLIKDFFNPNNFINGKRSLLKSYILEETFIHHILEALANPAAQNSAVVIPDMLSTNNNKMWYLDRTNPTDEGELSYILDVLHITGAGAVFGANDFTTVLDKALEVATIIYTKEDSLAIDAAKRLEEKRAKQKALLRSQIISATMIDRISKIDFVKVPSAYKLTNIKTEYNLNNIWYTSSELFNIFNAINELKLPALNNAISFDVNSMLKDTFDFKTICNSKIMYLTLSNNIVNNTSKVMIIPYNTYKLDNTMNEKVLLVDEIVNLINGFKVLGLSSFDSGISVPKASQVMESCNSTIIKATISNKILLALNNIKLFDNPNLKVELNTILDANLNESQSKYVSLAKEDIRDFVAVLNTNTSSGFEFKINSIADIANFNADVFNSRIAIGVINNYIFSSPQNKQAFLFAMKQKDPTYTIGIHQINDLTVNSSITLKAEYITKEDLLKFKNSTSII